MIVIKIHDCSRNKDFSWFFDENRRFKDLKNELNEQYIIKKEGCYFEVNGKVINDDMIKDCGVEDYSLVNIISNDCAKIKLEAKDSEGDIKIMQWYMSISHFTTIKQDENKEVKV